jgi:Transglycosylase SLT domain
MTPNLQTNASLLQPQGNQGLDLVSMLKLAAGFQNLQKDAAAASSGDVDLPPEITSGQSAQPQPQPQAQGNKSKLPQASPQMAALYAQHEQKYALPDGYLNTTAGIESGHNPQSFNQFSGARGVFQFIPSTAKQYGLKDPYDPVASTDAAARLAADNQAELTKALGRPPTAGELYLAHQQGAAGAIKILQNPDAQAVSLFKNPKVITQNGGNANMSARQFGNMWVSKFDNTTKQANAAPAAAPAEAAPSQALAYAGTGGLGAIPPQTVAEAKTAPAGTFTPGGHDDPIIKEFETKPLPPAKRTFTPGGADDPIMKEFGDKPEPAKLGDEDEAPKTATKTADIVNPNFGKSPNERVEQGFERGGFADEFGRTPANEWQAGVDELNRRYKSFKADHPKLDEASEAAWDMAKKTLTGIINAKKSAGGNAPLAVAGGLAMGPGRAALPLVTSRLGTATLGGLGWGLGGSLYHLGQGHIPEGVSTAIHSLLDLIPGGH